MRVLAMGEFVGLGLYFEGKSRGLAEGLGVGCEKKRRIKDCSQV